MLFDVGRASGTKLCRLLWNTNFVEIELSSLCLPWSLYCRGVALGGAGGASAPHF